MKLWSDEVVAERAIFHPKSTACIHSIVDVSRNCVADQCDTKPYGLKKEFYRQFFFSFYLFRHNCVHLSHLRIHVAYSDLSPLLYLWKLIVITKRTNYAFIGMPHYFPFPYERKKTCISAAGRNWDSLWFLKT